MVSSQLSNQSNNPTQHLAVFGASRGVGRHLVEQALRCGHRVTAVARDTSALAGEIQHPQLRLIAGSAADPKVVAEALDGVNVVVCTLGAPALSRSKIRSEGTQVIIDEMKHRGLRRILALSLLGAHETRSRLPFFVKWVLFPLYLRRPVREHERQESLLEKSGLEWTVLRPPFLIDGPLTGRYALDLGEDWSHLSLQVSRADAADFFVKQLGNSAHSRQKVGISYLKAG